MGNRADSYFTRRIKKKNMKSKEFITEDARSTKYEVTRLQDEDGDFTNVFVATANGEEIGRFEGKNRFDSGEANEAAKKCIIQHRTAAINAEDKIREHEYQYNKPLTDVEKVWVELDNRFLELNDAELAKWQRYAESIRKSLRDGTHPACTRTKRVKEEINPQVFRRGFEKTKEILGGKYMLKAYHGVLPYSSTKKINSSENFHIDAFTAKGNKVGNVTYKVTDNNLEAVFVTVDPQYRRQGIAKEMYIFAKELGNDIIPSTMRIYNGNDFGKGIAGLYKGGNITESKRLRGILPFSLAWTYYKVTSSVSFGDHVRSAGDNVALTTVNNKLIIWMMFGYDTPNGIGEFYATTNEEVASLGLKKVKQYLPDDILAAALYIQWDKARSNTRQELAQRFITLSVSAQFKTSPPTLYRGLALSPESIASLKQGTAIPFNEQLVSSWSTAESNAMVFTGRNGGVVITKQVTPGEVIVNLEKLNSVFRLPLVERWGTENEILLKGNGIGTLLDPTIHKLSFGKMNKDGDFLKESKGTPTRKQTTQRKQRKNEN